MTDLPTAEIGIFGGSGFGGLLHDADEFEIATPWGEPSGPIKVGTFAGRSVAFVSRHGPGHRYPPHKIPYRANVAAMQSLGVTRLIAPCAAGSLQTDVPPGTFVICDQLVDRTHGRGDTFFDTTPVTHVSFADPYCPQLRPLAVDACIDADVPVRDHGTVVVIEGPRFSTRAESRWYTGQGWEVINMTQYPEAALAREAQICFVNISLITDFDTGLAGDAGIAPVTVDQVVQVFDRNNARLVDVLERLVAAIPAGTTCPCHSALDGAQL